MRGGVNGTTLDGKSGLGVIKSNRVSGRGADMFRTSIETSRYSIFCSAVILLYHKIGKMENLSVLRIEGEQLKCDVRSNALDGIGIKLRDSGDLTKMMG